MKKLEFKTLDEIKKTMEPIIKLQDANIIEINTGQDVYLGCSTCDYGSSYVTEITFKFDDDSYYRGEVSQEYDHLCSEQELMAFFLNNLSVLEKMTKEDLRKFFNHNYTYNYEELDESERYEKNIYYFLEGGN